MALLKSLIQRLLDSRTTPSEAGYSAMPGSVSTTLLSNASISDWGTVATGTAADDGYIVLTAKNGGNSGASLSLNVNGVARQSLVYPFVGAGGNAFTPIAKGNTWALIGSSSTEITLKLFKAIGGGYSILLWRALSCLRALSNYLPRSSFRTNPNGSAIKLCQTIQPSGLFTHLKAHPVNTSHRLTGMSLFTPVAMNGRKSGMETEVSSSPQRVLPTSAFKCLSLKAPKLGMSFRTPRPTELKKRPLSLFQQSERDALTGGALC